MANYGTVYLQLTIALAKKIERWSASFSLHFAASEYKDNLLSA